MKTTLIILFCLIVAILVLFFFLGVLSRSGEAPGLIDGKLQECPNKPNCVCSELKDDVKHYIAPIVIPQNINFEPLPVLKNLVLDMGGSIQNETGSYFAAIFSSDIYGFIDDLEIRLDPLQNVIHIRSASRVGYSDRGVNKRRVELLKQLYEKKILETKL